MEHSPEVVTLTRGTPCINLMAFCQTDFYFYKMLIVMCQLKMIIFMDSII